MDPVVVVGAGMAGVAAARRLQRADVAVVVLDRGARIGGRMAVRTSHGRPVDTGASYLTASDPGFEAVVADWHERGLARPWTEHFDAHDGEGFSRHGGPLRWGAAGGLRSLVEDLATGLDVRRETVERLDDPHQVAGLRASRVVLAMPDPQARRLLHGPLAGDAEALTDPFEPALALTARWEVAGWMRRDGVFVNDDETLSWIADDGRRRGDDAPVLVAHSTPGLARQHLDDPAAAAPAMLAALGRVMGIDGEPVEHHVHRWTFAKPASGHGEPFHLGAVGVCGDAWSDKPRVESAWLSGTALAEELLARG